MYLRDRNTHLYSSNDSKIKTVKTKNHKTNKQNVYTVHNVLFNGILNSYDTIVVVIVVFAAKAVRMNSC